MHDAELDTYPPLNTLKPVCENVWIVDGPIIRFGMPWPKRSLPTRMTVIRLRSGDLFIHSPTPLVASLKAEIEREGNPRFIIGPNRLHLLVGAGVEDGLPARRRLSRAAHSGSGEGPYRLR
jgi:hypothetical protein